MENFLLLITLLMLASVFLLVVSVISPKVISNITGHNHSRKQLAAFFGAFFVGSFFFIGLFAPPVEDASVEDEVAEISDAEAEREMIASAISIEGGEGEEVDDQYQEKLFLVTRVIDGDTIELENGDRVRYIGMDTPESVHPNEPVQCFSAEASKKNAELVLNKQVRLEKDITDIDRYGRLLRYVYVGDTFINFELVRQGFAHSYTYPPDVKHQGLLSEAQSDAKKEKAGLWGSCVGEESKSTENVSSDSPIQEKPLTNNEEKIQKELLNDETSAKTTPTESTPVIQPEPELVTQECVVKGNISSSGERIYHVPGCASYSRTKISPSKGERWFCSEQEAVNAGWRKAQNC